MPKNPTPNFDQVPKGNRKPSEAIFTDLPNSNCSDHWFEAFDRNVQEIVILDEGAGKAIHKGGKWIIRFPIGSPDLDNAWEKAKRGVCDGIFHTVKVSPQKATDSEGKPVSDQVLLVYACDSDDASDVGWIHDEIKHRGISKGAISQELEYKRDEATIRGEYGPDSIFYTSRTIAQHTPAFARRYIIKGAMCGGLASLVIGLAAGLVAALAFSATALPVAAIIVIPALIGVGVGAFIADRRNRARLFQQPDEAARASLNSIASPMPGYGLNNNG